MVLRRRMSLRVEKCRYIRTVYSDEHLAALAQMKLKNDEIHFSGYLSRDRLLRIVTSFMGLDEISLPTWAYERLKETWWWPRLASWIRSFVKEKTYSRKFWTERNTRFVRQMFLAGHEFSEISEFIYRLFNHKIKTRTLIRRACVLGWLPGRRPPPFLRSQYPFRNY